MLKPLGDRVVVQFVEKEEKTASGFVIAGASREATKTAIVLAVGSGLRSLTGEVISPSVAVGDTVLVEAASGLEVTDGDRKVTVVREADIVAIVE